jgi:hypothetical protein
MLWNLEERGSISPCILTLGTTCRWVVRFTPRPLNPRVKIPRYHLDRVSNRSGLDAVRKRKLSSICREYPVSASIQLVARRYTDRAIPHPGDLNYLLIWMFYRGEHTSLYNDSPVTEWNWMVSNWLNLQWSLIWQLVRNVHWNRD